ncbi:hypothetical protein BCR44DRAFT_60876 [Catenaria anguillulae PL171]|uniref:Uncharacterized protein n=1 Tax=Catenaria anguillulae PL171 TaxID=765915 RepID=A0A1Y2H9N3_9FUNG|nr:hypothetical protein BCR44DRAFT_60876 [Catenaria anguillulae PL171]
MVFSIGSKLPDDSSGKQAANGNSKRPAPEPPTLLIARSAVLSSSSNRGGPIPSTASLQSSVHSNESAQPLRSNAGAASGASKPRSAKSLLFAGLLSKWLPPIPLALLLALLMGGTQGLLGFLSWQFPYTTGDVTATRFASDLQGELLALAVTKLQTHIDTAERLVKIQRAMWSRNIFNVTTANARNYTMQVLLDTLVTYSDMVVTQTFTTPQGGLNGYYVSVNPSTGAGEYTQWVTDDAGNYMATSIDPRAPTVPLAVLDSIQGYNASADVWVTQVQPLDPAKPPVWSPAYAWGGVLWLTLSLGMFAPPPASTYLGVGCTDLDLGFISRQLAGVVANNKQAGALSAGGANLLQAEGTVMVVLEAGTNVVLGTSIAGQLLITTDPLGMDRAVTLADMATMDPRMKEIDQYFTRVGARPEDKEKWAFAITDNLVQTTIVRSSNPQSNVKWVALVILPEQAILGPIRSGTGTTAAIAGGLTSMSVLLSTIMAVLIAKSLDRISLDMQRLSRFEFNQVISNKSELKHTSYVSELLELQIAFFELVRAFSRDMRDAKKGAGTRQTTSAHHATTGHGQTQTGTGHGVSSHGSQEGAGTMSQVHTTGTGTGVASGSAASAGAVPPRSGSELAGISDHGNGVAEEVGTRSVGHK